MIFQRLLMMKCLTSSHYYTDWKSMEEEGSQDSQPSFKIHQAFFTAQCDFTYLIQIKLIWIVEQCAMYIHITPGVSHIKLGHFWQYFFIWTVWETGDWDFFSRLCPRMTTKIINGINLIKFWMMMLQIALNTPLW